MSESKYKYHGIYDLIFYKCDEDSNMETNEDGSIKLYTSKQNIDLSDVSDWFDTEDLIEDNFDDFTSASTSEQQTIKNLERAIENQATLLEKIVDFCDDEVKENEEHHWSTIVDGTGDICRGRLEFPESILTKVKNWEGNKNG